jgi:hypothetical protein
MTFKQRRRKKKMREAFYALKRRSRTQYKLSKSITPFGKTMKVPFRYVSRISLNPTLAGGVVKYTYSANGLYDPDITAIGHQPNKFDQLVGVFYNHYTVTSCNISCTFMSESVVQAGRHVVGIIRSSGTTVPSTFNAIIENKLNVKYNVGGTMNGGASKTVVKHKCNLSSFLGQKVLSEDDNSGTNSTNPKEQVYFNIFASSLAVDENGDPIDVLVVLDYVATLHERINLNDS